MNSILTTNSEINRTNTSKSEKDVETTGSLAMLNTAPLFNIPVANYDMFIPTNPFSLTIDYGSYAEQENNTLANNSSFMQGFANAMSILADASGSYGSFGGAGCGAGASAGFNGGSCSAGGGFTSVG